MMEHTGFITPLRAWDAQIEKQADQQNPYSKPPGMFAQILSGVVGQVKESQADVENKQFLLATGQLEDAHSLPIAETKAAISLELLVSLRNKALESYNEIMKMSV